MQQPKPYKVKRLEPLPPGEIYFDSNGMGGVYMGRSASKNAAGKYPAYPFKALIRIRSEDADEDDDGVSGEEIGYVKGWVLRYVADDGSFKTMIDSLTGESAEGVQEMARAVLNENGLWVDDDEDGDEMGDLIFIQEIYVQPKFRGYGLSLLAVSHLIKLPGYRMARVIISSKPLSPSHFADKTDPLAVELSAEKRKAALKALGRHWKLLGFTSRHQEQAVEYWSQWMGYRQPHIYAVLPHLES